MVRKTEAELVRWLRDHNIPELFETISGLLLQEKPDQPTKYLLNNQQLWRKDEEPADKEQIVYIVRHGHRIDDFDPTWSEGTDRPYDPPLTPEGIETASKVGVEFSELPDDEKPVHVISSPFIRCVQTAVEIAKKLGIPTVCINYSIGEIHSEQVLKHSSEPEYVIPDEIDGISINHDNPGTRPPFPEERSSAFVRYSEAFSSVPDSPYKNMVLVSHGEAVGQSVSSLLPNMTVFDTPYCCYTIRTRTSRQAPWELRTETNGKVQWMDLGD
eukprot:TRINITY_DN19697_c0_g1_i1.p1 TRINITY_DN19697_c0_g1~~TRINITY_DN19697_c0_g1_i1.p1  ORF type:complete len:271 (+),score=33.08 TRINITY_DN19697_c0_g1_i1:110-922(+)